MLTPTRTSWSPTPNGRANASRMRAVSVVAMRSSGRPHWMTANSSPPRRASVSASRTVLRMRSAIRRKSVSPAA